MHNFCYFYRERGESWHVFSPSLSPLHMVSSKQSQQQYLSSQAIIPLTIRVTLTSLVKTSQGSCCLHGQACIEQINTKAMVSQQAPFLLYSKL